MLRQKNLICFWQLGIPTTLISEHLLTILAIVVLIVFPVYVHRFKASPFRHQLDKITPVED